MSLFSKELPGLGIFSLVYFISTVTYLFIFSLVKHWQDHFLSYSRDFVQ